MDLGHFWRCRVRPVVVLVECRGRFRRRPGLGLGVLNMGNIYTYVKAHQSLADSPSVVFTGMNVGVIALATVVGVVCFKESLNKINIAGLALAIACVLVLFLG